MRIFGRYGKRLGRRVSQLLYRVAPSLSSEAQCRQDLLLRYAQALSAGVRPRQAAALLGVSLRTIRTWQQRQRHGGAPGLEPYSRRPHRVARASKNNRALQQAIIRCRHFLPVGKDKLTLSLRELGYEVSASTVGRAMHALMLAGKLPRLALGKRRRAAGRPAQQRPHAKRWQHRHRCAQPGDCLMIDTMHAPMQGRSASVFTAIDGCSRWAYAWSSSQATAAAATRFLTSLIAAAPFIIRTIQVDGGSEFMASFEQACQQRNIELIVLPPRSPQLNGRVEAFNGTLRRELFNFASLAENLADLQELLREYIFWYNHERPHYALHLKTPYDKICNYPLIYPSAVCIEPVHQFANRQKIC